MNAPALKFVQCNSIRQTNLEHQSVKFWEIEEAPITRALSQEEKDCEAHFVKTTRRDKDRRFVVSMSLFVTDVLRRIQAVGQKSSINLEKRIKRLPELREEYVTFLKDYERLGHMKQVSEELTVPYSYYLLHHCVIKSESTITKTRMVFDASALTTNGRSLNSIQMMGPAIQDDLFSIIIRFRKHAYIISADITKMYR